MKVLLVHARYALPGGEERIVDTQEAILTARGHTVVRYEENNGDLEPSLATAARGVWSRPAERAVARLIASERPDVMHVHNHFPAVSPSVFAAANRAGVPTLQHLHNARLTCIQPFLLRDGAPCTACVGRLPVPGVVYGCYRDSRAQSVVAAGTQIAHRALRTWRRRVGRFVAVSESLAEVYRRSGVVPDDRLTVCENGVAADPGLRSTGTGTHMLYLGRLSPEKGVDVLIEAARLRPATRTVIAGDGPAMRSLQERASGLDNVEFTGRVDGARLDELLRGARALVAPSLGQEPFGMTVVEAASVGVAAIVTAAGALPDLVTDGLTGAVVPPSDASALADAMARIDDVATATRFGRAARERFEQRWSPVAFGDRLEALYAEVLQAP